MSHSHTQQMTGHVFPLHSAGSSDSTSLQTTLSWHGSCPSAYPKTLLSGCLTAQPPLSPHHWLMTFSVPHFPAIHTLPFAFFEEGLAWTYTRYMHSWWNTGHNISPDFVFIFQDKKNHWIVFIVISSHYSSSHSFSKLYNTSTFSNIHISLVFFSSISSSPACTSHFPDALCTWGQQI